MTFLGKLLTFVNFILAAGMVSWSVTLYSTRPGWLEAKPEGGYPAGAEAQNFALLKDEIDGLGRAAIAASTEWGVQRTRLDGLEKQRADRLKGYAQRLGWARDGRNPKDPNSPGFFEPVYEARTGLLDFTTVGDPIVGPDNLPLRGVNKLGANVAADVAEIEKRSKEITKYRDDFQVEGTRILGTEARLLKMGVIRDAVQAELFYLASFEVNVYETRETVQRRKRQLTAHLAELGGN